MKECEVLVGAGGRFAGFYFFEEPDYAYAEEAEEREPAEDVDEGPVGGLALELLIEPGLGWIGGDVAAIEPADTGLKIPHMGWNELEPRSAHPIVAGIGAGVHAYFVHSYHFRLADPADLVASTDYGGALAAVIGRDNLAGTQFHPEKSQEAGLRLIVNFLRCRP